MGVALNPITHISRISYIINELDYILIITADTGLLGQSFVQQTLKKLKE